MLHGYVVSLRHRAGNLGLGSAEDRLLSLPHPRIIVEYILLSMNIVVGPFGFPGLRYNQHVFLESLVSQYAIFALQNDGPAHPVLCCRLASLCNLEVNLVVVFPS